MSEKRYSNSNADSLVAAPVRICDIGSQEWCDVTPWGIDRWVSIVYEDKVRRYRTRIDKMLLVPLKLAVLFPTLQLGHEDLLLPYASRGEVAFG